MVPLNIESSHFGPDGTKNRWGHFLFAAFYLRKSSGSFAIFAAIRRASLRVSSLPRGRRTSQLHYENFT
jgi:hypothetical protein